MMQVLFFKQKLITIIIAFDNYVFVYIALEIYNNINNGKT